MTGNKCQTIATNVLSRCARLWLLLHGRLRTLALPPPSPLLMERRYIGQSENVGMMHVGTGSLEISSWGGDSLQCFLPAARSLIYERKREAKDQIPEEILLLIYDRQAFHLTPHRGQLVRVHYFYSI